MSKQTSDGAEWVQAKDNEWHLRHKGSEYVTKSVSFGATDGVPHDTTCFHLHDYNNGATPDDQDLNADIDYLHICHLRSFAQQLIDLADALGLVEESWA